MDSLREIFGAKPEKNSDGTYSPSKASMKVAVSDSSGYNKVDYARVYTGADRKVLVLCTEEDHLKCENDKIFRTGNHPVELFVVIRHLEQAGFSVDLATPTGKPVAIEKFAIPQDDDVVSNAMKRHEAALKNPLPLEDVVANLDDNSPYIAVYLPGGHGATQGAPFSHHVKHALQWFIDKDLHIITLCHGPALLLSLTLDEESDSKDFPLSDYSIAAFPDSSDKMLTMAGYLPGEMPYYFGERLESRGMKIVNHLPTGTTHTDRKLISGDSPMASDDLGKKAAEALLDVVLPASANRPTAEPA